ncbi:hypothetical protein C5167_043806 [Papaver somniferum]|uniref:Uncharacterized protein n=1 Tax=Papaver somniferum TaxID=3469 RepID=A0A4Y7L8E5_PAPSO|nr:hypothetical protein C5167_043806 [Papaver somniferum]
MAVTPSQTADDGCVATARWGWTVGGEVICRKLMMDGGAKAVNWMQCSGGMYWWRCKLCMRCRWKVVVQRAKAR